MIVNNGMFSFFSCKLMKNGHKDRTNIFLSETLANFLRIHKKIKFAWTIAIDCKSYIVLYNFH